MKWFDEHYEKESYEIQLKVPSFFSILIIMTAFSLFLLKADLLSSIPLGQFISHAIMGTVTIINLIMLTRGKYDFSANFFFVFVFLTMAVLRIIHGFEAPIDLPLLVTIQGSFLVISSIYIYAGKQLFKYSAEYMAPFLPILSCWE